MPIHTVLAILMLALLGGCTVLPGGSVSSENDSPAPGWTEATFRETYGTPEWTARGPDGNKLLYFRYKTAPDSKTLAIATAITTFGMVTDAGSLDYQLLGMVDGSGQFVCADRARFTYSESVQCKHEQRLAIREALSGQQRNTYQAMLKDIDRTRYVPGHYQVVNAPVLTDEAKDAAIKLGNTREFVKDNVYYFNAECALLTRWYVKHAEALGEDTTEASAAAIRFAKGTYESGGSRGYGRYQIEQDIDLYAPALATTLRSPWMDSSARRARTCIGGETTWTWTEGIASTDSAIHARIRTRMELMRGLLIIQQPDDVPTPNDIQLLSAFFMNSSLPYGKTETDLLAEKEALEEGITLASAAEPIDGTTLLLTQLIREGRVPPRDLVRRMSNALDTRIALGDHAGSIRILANIGRYYLAHTTSGVLMEQGIDILIDTAEMADHIGDFETAVALAHLAGDMALKNIQLTLATDGLNSESARDDVREILSFVPYSYERTAWDGSVTRYEVRAAPIDAQGLLSLIRELGRLHNKAAAPLAYAASFGLPPAMAARYFEELGWQAAEGFSSAGAVRYYTYAATAYERSGNQIGALESRFNAAVSRVVANSTKAKDKRRTCEGSYREFRQDFDKELGDPTEAQVKDLFGEDMRKKMRKYDKLCKYK
ncbi:MAG: hypothetical protein AAF290_11950 [Pseudomonadota bacterium]